MNKLVSTALGLALLTACQHQQPNIPPATPALTDSTASSIQSDGFHNDTLYDLLVAELAGQRNQPVIAMHRYNRQAQDTQSARIAERAWQIADFLDDPNSALSNALLWAQRAPDNAAARRTAAVELAKASRFDEAMVHMEQAIRLEPESDSHFDFIAFAAAHGKPRSRATLLRHFDELLQRHPEQQVLRLGKAILLQEDQPRQALQLLIAIPTSKLTLPMQVMQARLYQQLDQQQKSLDILQQVLHQQPENSQLRMGYARQLIANGQLDKARDQFLELLAQEPDNDDFRLALAYLYMDLESWREAASHLQTLIDNDSYTDTALYNLARCHEQLDQQEQAFTLYTQIHEGQFYLAARQRLGEMLLQQKRLPEFTRLFADSRAKNPDDSDALVQIETELLMADKQPELAWQRLQEALAATPDSLNLLYSRAMVAERRDDLAQLELDLRRILQLDPEHAMAMNALGYTLTDRTDRHDEALELIQRAHELQPDDPATQDSLGWVLFNQGKPSLALPWLEKAYAVYPDAEVAAHLGEVLWSLGQHAEARKVWREALDNNPGHEVLLKTLKRLDNRKEWLK